MATGRGESQRPMTRPFALWVLVSALVYGGGVLLGLLVGNVVSGATGLTDPLPLVALLLAAAVVAGALLALVAPGWVRLATILTVGALAVAAFVLVERAGTSAFWIALSAVPPLGLALVFGLGLWTRRPKEELETHLVRAFSSGGLAAGVSVGLAVAFLLIGVLPSLPGPAFPEGGEGADVLIVRQASSVRGEEAYAPSNLTVSVGDTVSWWNGDLEWHTVTSDAAGGFDSGTLRSGEWFNVTFTEPGVYRYHCTPHPWMKGTIIVEEA